MSGIINTTGAKSGVVQQITRNATADDVGLGNVDNTADASQVAVGALNAGSLTSGFGTIDTGSSTITTTGALACATVNTGQGAVESYGMDQSVGTGNTPRFESLNQYESSANVGIQNGQWGTLWDVSGWGKGQYYWEVSQGEGYPWTVGWIVKGQLGFTNFGRYITGTYTNHRFSGTSFQVYHGISWGGSMGWAGKWRKILHLA